MNLLVGDIGGTRVRLRLLGRDSGDRAVQGEMHGNSEDFDSLEQALAHCLEALSPAQRRSIAAACFAVAGTVREGQVRFTNLDWCADEQGLAAALGLPCVRLINDLEALARGIESLSPSGLTTVKAGRPRGDRRLVVAVGTGLGVAVHHGRDGVLDSEGGHMDFAPVDERQLELWRLLRMRYGHASYERVLSGHGLTWTYEFLCGRRHVEPGRAYWQNGRHPADVIELARHDDPDALATIELFTSILGAFAGNAALYGLTTGGVYLGGGVLLHMRQLLDPAVLARTFEAKGRMSQRLREIPLQRIEDPDVALLGARRVAESMAASPVGA